MVIVIQRVQNATVNVRDKEQACIENGLMLLVGLDKTDTQETLRQAVQKILKIRIFEDDDGKMNHSIIDVEGELLVVPNFTLSADTENGNRPSFHQAAPPDQAEELFDQMADLFDQEVSTQKGVFGAYMEVNLLNDGPVTFTLKIDE